MGNSNVTPNKAGFVESFTDEEYELYEPQCRPDHDRVKNRKNAFLGFDFYSDTGFISDQDSLKDVAQRDAKFVTEKLGEHGHQIIAIKLKMVVMKISFQNLQEKNSGGLLEELEQKVGPWNEEDFKVEQIEYCGNQGCPFFKKVMVKDEETGKETEEFAKCGHPGSSGGVDYTITNLKNGKVLKSSPLNNHLIFHHHFYEGDVPYRVDPALAIEVLDIPRI
jgi:hypothetical protein